MRGPLAASAFIFAQAAACSLTTLDGFTGGPAIADGGPTGLDGSTTAPSGDATPNGSSTDASTTSFCGSHPKATLCLDFDEVSPSAATGWRKEETTGCTLSLGTGHQSPNALRSTVSTNSATCDGHWSHTVLLGATKRLTFGMMAKPETLASGEYASAITIYTDTSHYVALILAYSDAMELSFAVQPGGATTRHPATGLVTGRWHHLEIVVEYDARNTSSTVDLRIDGTSAVGGPKAGPPRTRDDITVRTGLYGENMREGLTWSFDDILVELE